MGDSFRCPICHREVSARDGDGRFRPFCSDRCRTIDLGGWLEGSYRITGTVDDDEDPPPDPGESGSGDA
jgi:endogenous inhibitor of DNA gyrase (YacG/DUF329 family)